MARGVLTLTEVNRNGVDVPTLIAGDAVNGHTVNNDGYVMIWAKNTNAAATTRSITFRQRRGVDAQAAGTRVEVLNAQQQQLFGPFSLTDYGEDLQIDVSNAELTLGAIHFVGRP
jgi:hypothetical protein